MIKLVDILNELQKSDCQLLESPWAMGPGLSGDMRLFNDTQYNATWIQKLKNMVTDPVTYFESESGKKYAVYSYSHDGKICDAFTGEALAFAMFTYSVKNNDMYSSKVWQDMQALGLCRDAFFNYYLPKFNRIISDVWLSKMGIGYWTKIVKEALHQGYNTYLIGPDEKTIIDIYSDKELTKYITDNPIGEYAN